LYFTNAEGENPQTQAPLPLLRLVLPVIQPMLLLTEPIQIMQLFMSKMELLVGKLSADKVVYANALHRLAFHTNCVVGPASAVAIDFSRP
jgi:hypothetical protein